MSRFLLVALGSRENSLKLCMNFIIVVENQHNKFSIRTVYLKIFSFSSPPPPPPPPHTESALCRLPEWILKEERIHLLTTLSTYYKEGEILSYMCRSGYGMLGRNEPLPQYTCSVSGTWQPALGQCLGKCVTCYSLDLTTPYVWSKAAHSVICIMLFGGTTRCSEKHSFM